MRDGSMESGILGGETSSGVLAGQSCGGGREGGHFLLYDGERSPKDLSSC